MKPPSNIKGGGYRRKAEQDTLGRNSRLRYSYLASDKRMIPYSSTRLRKNLNKPTGRTSQPDMGETGTVTINFEMPQNGVAPSYNRLMDVVVTDISALQGTLLRIEAEIEILANPVLNTTAHTQIAVLATSIGRTYLANEIATQGSHKFTGAEYYIPTTHRQKVFQARRIRVHFYNIDSGNPVLEKTSAFTEYFCYSPTVGIANTVNAFINYITPPNATVFDYQSASQTAKIVTRFDNFAFTGNSDGANFKLAFKAGSTSSYGGQVFYEESHAFNPNVGLPRIDVELIQPDAPITENYSVNNHDVDLIPEAWPSEVSQQLGYGWDPSWNSPVSVSPSTLTTLSIVDAALTLVQGIAGTTNQYKTFQVRLDSINALNVANVGQNIDVDYLITPQRSGRNVHVLYQAAMAYPLDPTISTPAIVVGPVNNILRTNSLATDDIRGPLHALLRAEFYYTGTPLLFANDLTNDLIVPPYFNTLTLALQNQTQNGYDIVVTAFDGFTAFNQNGASGETPHYEFELNIGDSATSNQPPLYTATNIQFTGSTVPFTIKTVSRAAGSPDLSWFPASYASGHDISVYMRYTVATSGFTQTVYNPPAGPFMMYSGFNVLSSSSFTNQSLPSYTSSSVSIINQTNTSFEIELTTLVADTQTAFAIEFEVLRPNNNPNSLPEKSATSVNIYGGATNQTIYAAERLLQDTDWWRGDPNSHTFDVVVRVKYGTHVFDTHTVTTQSFPPALIWRFKGNSSCLSDIDGHGLTWVVNNANTTITYNANDIELTGTGFNHDIRLYNTNNLLDDKCMNIGLFRNATFGVRAHPVVTTAASVFNVSARDDRTTNGTDWPGRLYNIQLYNGNLTGSGHRTSGIYQYNNAGLNPPIVAGQTVIQKGQINHGYNFYYNKIIAYTQADFPFMRTYETGVTGNVRAPGISTRFAATNSTDSYFVKHNGGNGLNPLNFTAGVISHIHNNDNEGVGLCGGTHLVDPNGVTRSDSSFGTATGYGGVTSGGAQDALFVEAKFYNSGGKLEGIYLYPH